jgi:hypothetical protein
MKMLMDMMKMKYEEENLKKMKYECKAFVTWEEKRRFLVREKPKLGFQNLQWYLFWVGLQQYNIIININ